MDDLTQKIIDRLLDWGADLVGIAPVDRFANAPEGNKPTDFMPECKSVISIALHLQQGLADVWGDVDEPGKTVTPYLFYGYGLTNMESSRIVNRMAKQLEYAGHKSLCFLPTWTTSMYKSFDGLFEGSGRVAAEFSHRHAAVAAGIADFGWSTLALTPEFGAMQRFNSILTSAELEPTPLWSGPELCPKETCNYHCVRKCPAKALSRDEGQSATMGTKTVTYSTRDDIRCMYGVHGMLEGSGARSKLEIPEGPGRIEHFLGELHGDNVHMADRAMLDNCFGIICGDFCGKCLHQCSSKKLLAKEMKDIDLTGRHSSLGRLSI